MSVKQMPGLDDPSREWLRRVVRVKSRPEWGVARVIRWYPATEGRPETLRVMAQGVRSQQLVSVDDVELLDGREAG